MLGIDNYECTECGIWQELGHDPQYTGIEYEREFGPRCNLNGCCGLLVWREEVE